MTSYPTGDSHPSGDEREQRWQQPAFAPQPINEPPTFKQSGQGMQPFVSGPVVRFTAPPSVSETIVGTLAGLVWPVAILLIIFTNLGFWPGIITAMVVGAVLGGVKKNLKARRRAVLPPQAQFGPPPDLR